MATQTLSTLANLIGKSLSSNVVYEAINVNPLLAHMPIIPWEGDGDTLTYSLMTGTPTAATTDIDGSSLSSTKATFGQVTAKLANLYSQGALSQFARNGSVNRQVNARVQHEIAHSRALVRKLLSLMATGQRQSVSIGATAASKGIDGVVPQARSSVSESSGILYFSFSDTGDTLKLSSDGGSNYGPIVTCGSDDLINQPMYDANGYEWRVTFDVSDSAGSGDWTTTNAATGVTVSAGYDFDGLASLVHGSQMIWGDGTAVGSTSAYTAGSYHGSANGDATSLKRLDQLIDMVPWASVDPGNCVLIMPPRTVRTNKHLFAVGGGGVAGAGASVAEWMGATLNSNYLSYSRIPIIKNPDISKSLTVGTTTDATTIYLAYLGYEGVHCQWTNDQSVALQVAEVGGPIVSDADLGSMIPMPFYARWLQEGATSESNIFRVSGKWSMIARNKQALAACQGITD